jgi:hypothetical protein
LALPPLQVVVSSLEVLDKQLDPSFIAKNSLMPLLEVGQQPPSARPYVLQGEGC